MTDEVEQRLAKGSVEVVTGMATGSPLKMGQGLLTMLGLETNASAMQKYVAAEYESFVTDTLQGLTEQSAQHKKRLDTFEQRQLKMAWVVEEFERQLGEKGARPSDLVALLEAGFEVWKKNADARKRKLLGNALRNAFDPKQYEEGLTLRLFSILRDLNYGEIYVLRELKGQFEKWPKDKTGALRVTNADFERFRSHDLTPPLRTGDVRPDSLLADYIKRLRDHGLVFTKHRGWVHDDKPTNSSLEMNALTELGERLLTLTADAPAPTNDAT